MKIKYLLEKEFKQFFRNPILPKIALVYPLIVVLVFPWVTNFNVENMKISIVDKDRTETTRKLTEEVKNSRYFDLYKISDSYADALRDVQYGRSDAILELPDGFGKDYDTGKVPQVLIAVNSVNEIKGTVGAGYLVSMLSEFKAGREIPETSSAGVPVTVHSMNLYNPEKDYKLYMIPAIMVMILIILCGFMPALNIVQEKEAGTIEQINVTPVPRFTFILAKLIPFWIMGFVSFTIGMLIALAVYGFAPCGSFLTVYAGVMLFVVLISGIGLIISNYASTMQQALFMMFFIVMIFTLMSGLFTPVTSMPAWARKLSYIIPPRYLMDIMRSAYIKGSGIADNAFNFSMLLVFAMGINIWAVLSYRKRS